MKVIFTDIDGVLKPFRSLNLGIYESYDECVGYYNRIFEAIPDLKIVVSSAWRNEKYYVEERLPSMIDIFKRNEIIGEVVGITCDYPTPESGPWDVSKERGIEISVWLEEHDVSKFIILDDDDLGFSNLFTSDKYLIVADRYEGLTLDNSNEIIERMKL